MALAGQFRKLGARRGLTLVGSGFVGNALSQELALLHRPKTHVDHAFVIATPGGVSLCRVTFLGSNHIT